MSGSASAPPAAERSVSEAEADYDRYTAEFCAHIGDKGGWPTHVLTDPTKRPRVVVSTETFISEMLTGCHIDRIVMLPPAYAVGSGLDLGTASKNALHPGDAAPPVGIAAAPAALVPAARIIAVPGAKHRPMQPVAVDLDQVLESAVASAIRGAESAREVLTNLAKNGKIDTLKGNMFIKTNGHGRKDAPIRPADGEPNTLAAKWAVLNARDDVETVAPTVNLAEVRHLRQYYRGRRSYKTTLRRTMRDRVGAEDAVYWDDYSEGLFVSSNGAGYNLHVDQLQTSNVGTQFLGHKLLAIWSYPDMTTQVLEDHFRTVFSPPITADQVKLLETACVVALLPPGTTWFFSGANAHAACNLGFGPLYPTGAGPPDAPLPLARTVCVNSYEAYVGINPEHVRLMTTTNVDPFHWDGCWMDDEGLRDFKDDVEDRIDYLKTLLETGSIKPDMVKMMQESIQVAGHWAASTKRRKYQSIKSPG